MHYFRPLLGALIIIFNFYYTAQAQQELAVLRASSINQGTHQTFQAPYQWVIKHVREATTAAGFDIESLERLDENAYMMLGKKAVAGAAYGEMIQVLAIRKGPTKSEVRLLIRRQISLPSLEHHTCTEEIYATVRKRVSLVNL